MYDLYVNFRFYCLEALKTKKLKNDTKFADLFELKAIVNQSLKEPLSCFNLCWL